MKKLALALAFLPMVAYADSWSMPNKNNGEIVITDRDCRSNGKSYAPLKQAYSYYNGGYIEGCWHVEDGMIKVIWNLSGNAETRIYDPKEFTKKSTDNKSQGKGNTL